MCVIPLTYACFALLKTDFADQCYNGLSYTLDYEKDTCVRRYKTKQKKSCSDPNLIYYGDFESDVTGDIHTPYLCIIQNYHGNVEQVFKGVHCARDLLEYLPNEAIVYFHNLAYDSKFIAKYGVTKSTNKGTRVLAMKVEYKKKEMYFRDTLPILSCKLSLLPSMFGIEGVKKEIFPYRFYTLERLRTGIGNINEAGATEDIPWTEAQQDEFRRNIESIPNCRTGEDTFDMWEYAIFYCRQDVRILREGFNKFCAGFESSFNISPFDYLSISSLANEVFSRNVYAKNENLYQVGGHVRHFIARAVYGGRCMCAYNKKWHVHKELCDFDAVSLYPSAMARITVISGPPKVIQPGQLNMDFLETTDAYVVEIQIKKVGKHYPFPLIVQRVDGLNLNDDQNIDEEHPVTMVVDNIALEDLIRYQKIEFNLVKGYYWNEGSDPTIQAVIRDIFQKRVEYKRQKNPLQQIYKLIMNSCYGKTIEKPITKDWKFFKAGKKSDLYATTNYFRVIERVLIEDSNIESFKLKRPIDKHFNLSLLGVQVLSMSKRIMNEVMCLAYEKGCRIYYQDTDSMHIEKADLPKLENAFQAQFGRKLIGSDLGQFHSDFTSDEGRDDVDCAVESYFLMKKTYIDKLRFNDGTFGFMSRAKGIPQLTRYIEAKDNYDGDVMKMYAHLYEGNSIEFNLLKGSTKFKFNSNQTITNLDRFPRTLKTNYEEGRMETYFE